MATPAKMKFEYDQITDVMFVDLLHTDNPVDTVKSSDGTAEILIRIDMKTGEVVSLQIMEWKAFRRRALLHYGAYTTAMVVKRVLCPILTAARSISDYYNSRWLHPVLPNCN